MEKRCISCGAELESSFNFCHECGAEINGVTNSNNNDIKNLILLNKKNLILTLCSVCVVVIALVIGITFSFSNSNSDSDYVNANNSQEERWKRAKKYDLDENISQGGIYEFNIGYSEWSKGGKVYARNASQKTSGYIFGVDSNSENVFIVRGTCKNIATRSACSDLGTPDIKVIVVFDDKYVVEGNVKLEEPNGIEFYSEYNFNPKVELPITFYFPSSTEMQETYKKAVLYIHTIDTEDDIGRLYTTGGEDIEGVYFGVRLK